MSSARDNATSAGCSTFTFSLRVSFSAAGGGAVFYADTGGGPGSMLEVLQPAPGGREFFAMMRDAHRDWDGADPVRRLG